MTRALIAARKSNKVDGGEGHSLDTQDEQARLFCERLGWTVVGTARDTISGRVAPLDRKDLGAWIAEPSRFDVLVAFKSDRLSRGKDTDWSRIETWSADVGKTLVLVDSGTGVRYPARDDSDFWQWTSAKRQAGSEWENIRERIVRAHDALEATGSFIGRPPYGYRITGPKYARRLEVDEALSPIIAEVFQRTVGGESLATVAAWLEEVTGAYWHKVRIQRLIGNWVYAGRLERNGHHYADCPAIVPASVLVKAQQAMKLRRRGRYGGAPSDNPSLLIPGCADCQGRMYRGGNGGYYYCRGAKGCQGCGTSAPVGAVDAKVLDILGQSNEDEMRTVVVEPQDHRDELERLRRDRRQALERDDIAAVLAITEDIKALEAEPVVPARVIKEQTGRTVGEAFSAMTADEKRASLRAWTILVSRDGRLRVVSPWKIPK
jgi:DNA invertase Pin-like site-specific DNA recombinase